MEKVTELLLAKAQQVFKQETRKGSLQKDMSCPPCLNEDANNLEYTKREVKLLTDALVLSNEKGTNNESGITMLQNLWNNLDDAADEEIAKGFINNKVLENLERDKDLVENIMDNDYEEFDSEEDNTKDVKSKDKGKEK